MIIFRLQPGQSVKVKTKIAQLSSDADGDGVLYKVMPDDEVLVMANKDNTSEIIVTVME